MVPSLERHRRAILGMVVAVWLGVGAVELDRLPFDAARYSPFADLRLFVGLFPFLVVALVAVNTLVRALVSRGLGEALDRRPFHLATSAGALAVFAVLTLARGEHALAAAAVLGAGAAYVFALRDWSALVGIFRSKTLIEHVDPIASAPSTLHGFETPLTLFAPQSVGYRGEAKGVPVAKVPVDRALAVRLLSKQMLAILGTTAFALVVTASYARAQGAKAAMEANLAKPSTWRGEIDFGPRKDQFTLEIEQVSNGEMHGVMDWGNVAANVEGTYDGDRMTFYDRSIRRTNGAPFILNDRKDVRIVGDEMTGTDKAGRVRLHAVRVR